ncbi:MAG: NAD(P)/FAD-dependent oxidoreductase [Nanoarchaeota archaeon]|nr:NAD(P)/FAD-dependent oxidoreductase [Nanoarchaeota archaeon]
MISIIGGGPVGSYLASLLAPKRQVAVFEEHDAVGLPVQCTGITTQALAKVLNIRRQFLVNKVTASKIFAPNGKHIHVKLKNPNFIIDRTKFDRYVAEKAQEKGVKYYLGHKYKNCTRKNGKFELHFQDKHKPFQTDILVGADGPFSPVAKTTGLWKNRKMAVGVQARMSVDADPQTVEFYVGKGYFAWVVPESDKVGRVGTISYAKPNDVFKSFLKRRRLERCKIREYQSGVVPLHDPKIKTQGKNVYLVGDAATQVKATTFGGIVQGMMAAEELSKAILHNRNYEKLWKKRIGRDLRVGLMMRKKMDKFTDKKYNKLVNLFTQERVRKVLEKRDRDYPTKLMLELLVKEPRILGLLF